MFEKDIALCHPHRVPVTTAELHGSHEMSTAPLTETTSVEVYDTTLRDGAQQEGMNLSVADKLAIAPLLDELGVTSIEGGWPGAIPKDTEFFAKAAKRSEERR